MTAPNLGAKWSSWTPRLLSVLRIVAAFLFMQFGTAKLFAFPAAIMPGGGTAPIASLPGIAGMLETFGGLFLLVGLFTRPVAFILVIAFVMSVFSGMGVLVARFAGANEPEKVNRTTYQAFLAALALWGLVLAPLGWILAPSLLGVVNAAPAVRVEALPFLRIIFVGSIGLLLFFMVGGALRAAGDARTPLPLGILLTALNIACNIAFITGLGPLPRLGTAGAAVGTTVAGLPMSGAAVYLLLSGRLPVVWHRGMDSRPD